MSLVSRIKALTETMVIKAIAEVRPMTVQLDITNACNLACAHCYHPHHSNQGAIGLGEWMKILAKVGSFLDQQSFHPSFMICGGEPLLSPLLKPVITRMREQWPGSEILILTNGTVHREETLRFLTGHKVAYQISLDGPDSLRHDAVRGPGSFAKSMLGIEKLKQHGAHVGILSILSLRTSYWISEYFDLAAQIEVNSQCFTRLIAQGTGKNLVDAATDRPLKPLELKWAFTDIALHSFRTGIATNKDQPLFALLGDHFGQSGLFAFDALVIDYKGNLKATSRADLVLGNLLENDIADLYLRNPILRKVRNKQVEACGTCELYDRCGGDRNAAYAEFGDFTARDPGCWK